MSDFRYIKGLLHAEQVPIPTIIKKYGTPCYIYSRATLERNWQAFDAAFAKQPHSLCYSVKANSNLAVLNIMAQLDSGFDIVSEGELARVLAAKGDPKKVVFSGVGKLPQEIKAALLAGISCINIESMDELETVQSIANQLNTIAQISIRVNPNVNPKTHAYIATGLKENKFGIAIQSAETVYAKAKALPNIQIVGIDCHIGSQILTLPPLLDAFDSLLKLVDRLNAQEPIIKHINIGGGLGVSYQNEHPPTPTEYVNALIQKLNTHKNSHSLKIIIEPGRAIVAEAGILVTQVQNLKKNDSKKFIITDAGMNDLLRPALYQAWHSIIPVHLNIPTATSHNANLPCDIVGPVCETGDFLGKDRTINANRGDLLAVCTVGAYGFCMSSNYNTRPRAPEVMVDGDTAFLVRERETIEDLLAKEKLLPSSDDLST